ncbi:uncharacterized protein LOC115445213 isoform X1 [Manduca sexta]|uniref:BED-type domain-containing protein n=1 Tax=Manduca sexta TaxID=7130 RepID=A0A921Z872_MANSE|nr:uncharacterized protein LOC115445213 isoform X1 [Manduca sexta]KAG6452775.1 hypothetical protein O3G_MSEX007817 [Manduca sexta]
MIPGRRKAEIWKYFQKCDSKNKIAACNFCKKALSYKTTSTNLRIHLKLKHILEYNKLMSTSSPTAVYSKTCKETASFSSNSDEETLAAEDSPQLQESEEGTSDEVKQIHNKITQIQNKSLREFVAANNINMKKKQLKMMEVEHKLHVKIARLKIRKLQLEIELLSNGKTDTTKP